jgi:hypothetical protein
LASVAGGLGVGQLQACELGDVMDIDGVCGHGKAGV